MGKLTKAIKERILENVVKASTIEEEMQQIIKEEREIAVKKLTSIPELSDFHAKTKKLPKEWFRHVSSVSVPFQTAAGVILCRDGDYSSSVPIDPPMAVPVHYCMPNGRSDIWGDLFNDIGQRATALKKKKDDLESHLMDFLNSCGTIKQVLERMPELEPHVPHKVTPQGHLVPSTAGLVSAMQNAGVKSAAAAA